MYLSYGQFADGVKDITKSLDTDSGMVPGSLIRHGVPLPEVEDELDSALLIHRSGADKDLRVEYKSLE